MSENSEQQLQLRREKQLLLRRQFSESVSELEYDKRIQDLFFEDKSCTWENFPLIQDNTLLPRLVYDMIVSPAYQDKDRGLVEEVLKTGMQYALVYDIGGLEWIKIIIECTDNATRDALGLVIKDGIVHFSNQFRNYVAQSLVLCKDYYSSQMMYKSENLLEEFKKRKEFMRGIPEVPL